MKNRFLFELGLEEVPAEMIEPAATQLRKSVEALFEDNQLTTEALDTYAAPRRLAFLATGLPDRQPSREEVVLGPPVSVAFRDGTPAPAAHGARQPCIRRQRSPVGDPCRIGAIPPLPALTI